MPVYEPGLEEMVKRNVTDGRLKFSTDVSLIFNDSDVIFCAIETQTNDDGSTDLSNVLQLATQFGTSISKHTIFVLRSTVPVGTAKKVEDIIADQLEKRGALIDFDVVSNPDFLTEGNAINDFMSPDRIVVGSTSKRAKEAMSKLYFPIKSNNFPIIYTDNTTAEMIKYAATSMLATRVSYMNEIANLCELVGADVNIVRRGVGSDKRIGSKYIYPGCGYGGTCFPKDIKDLINIAEQKGYSMDVLQAVDKVNSNQKQILFNKLNRHYNGDLKGKTIAVWGLAFKPQTDDISEAPSIVTLDLLIEAGCNVRVYDPAAMNQGRRRWSSIHCATDMYDAIKGCDALLLLTEWRQFRLPDWHKVKQLMNSPVVIDGRNIYNPTTMRELGFTYYCIGI